MGVKRDLESYRDEFYQKYPDKKYIKFIKKDKNHLIVEDKYSICKIAYTHLMNGYCPTIRVALDKNEYFINKAKEIHGNLYTYKNSIYAGCDDPIIVTCSLHGDFKITPHSLIPSKSGCEKCGYIKSSIKNGNNATGWADSDWFKKAMNSKHFDSFKCYIIKCWDENEEFYKVGKTFKTLKERLVNYKERMPYNWEIIKIFEFKDLMLDSAKEISIIERNLKNLNKENKYIPLQNIRGKYECFTQIKLK